MGEQTFFHAGEQHQGKLQPLGRMQAHQRHARVRFVLIGVADQRGMVKKLSQRLAPLLSVLRGIGQFLQVFNP